MPPRVYQFESHALEIANVASGHRGAVSFRDCCDLGVESARRPARSFACGHQRAATAGGCDVEGRGSHWRTSSTGRSRPPVVHRPASRREVAAVHTRSLPP